MPDGGRAEAANTGVLLFVPERRIVEVRASPSLERVRQFFKPGRTELRRIQLALEAFKNRIELARGEWESESDLAQFAAARADAIRLTPPRLVMVQEPRGDLDVLYRELVGDKERTMTEMVMHSQSLPDSVAEVFGRLEAEHRVWRPGKIKLPTINREFEVPIAYQNGRVNYVRPESLAAGKLDERLARLGFNGQLIFKHPIDNKQGTLVVLSSDPDASRDTEERFARTLGDFNVRFVPYEQAQAFAEEVEATAH
jgi:hypothetical protein